MTRTYTSRPVRVLLAFSGGVFGLAAGALLMGVVEETAWENAGLAVLVALVAAGVWRGATARVVAGSREVVVRNLFRTYRVRWTDVVRVKECEPFPWSATRSYPCPALLVRGRQWRVPLLAMTDLGDHRFRNVVKDWQRRHR